MLVSLLSFNRSAGIYKMCFGQVGAHNALQKDGYPWHQEGRSIGTRRKALEGSSCTVHPFRFWHTQAPGITARATKDEDPPKGRIDGPTGTNRPHVRPGTRMPKTLMHRRAPRLQVQVLNARNTFRNSSDDESLAHPNLSSASLCLTSTPIEHAFSTAYALMHGTRSVGIDGRGNSAPLDIAAAESKKSTSHCTPCPFTRGSNGRNPTKATHKR